MSLSNTDAETLVRAAITNAGSPRCREREHYPEGYMFADMPDVVERVLQFEAAENHLLQRLCARSLKWVERLEMMLEVDSREKAEAA